MDVYHKVLVKLYETTGGRDTQAVDFKELVKSLGFLGNYEDIFQKLNNQGWMAETPKANYVKITHWGVKEAQESVAVNPEFEDKRELSKFANRLLNESKEFLSLVEEFSADLSVDKFKQVEKKFEALSLAIVQRKESV